MGASVSLERLDEPRLRKVCGVAYSAAKFGALKDAAGTVSREQLQEEVRKMFAQELLGKRLPEVQMMWEQMTAMWEQMWPDGIVMDSIEQLQRAMLKIEDSPFAQVPDKFESMCYVEEVTFDGSKFGECDATDLKVWVYTPKRDDDDDDEDEEDTPRRPCQIWFHGKFIWAWYVQCCPGDACLLYLLGGSFLFCSAETFRKSCCRRAIQTNSIVFAPEIGTAPETKAPQWFWKGYAALKHVIAEAETYGVDTERIALTGENAGGYTAVGVAMELAKKDEGGLVKLVVTDVGAINNDFLTVPDIESSELYLKPKQLHLESLAYLCADYTDYETAPSVDREQFRTADPYIFPAQMPESLLPLLPPMVLLTREFDQVGSSDTEPECI